jgi:hypothetical protein
VALETGTYISDLVAANPPGTDPKSQMDDHLRLLKSTIKASFPAVAGAVSASHAELSYAAGVTSSIQVQFNLKAPLASPALTGTPTAPTASFGASGTQIATLDFVNAVATNAALPAQTGNSGKYVTTDGTTASWAQVLPSGATKYNKLKTNAAGTVNSWGVAGLKLAPVAGGTLSDSACHAILANASYTLPDLTTVDDDFALMALGNATSVPTSVTASDSWAVATGFVAGTTRAITPYSRSTAHGMWGAAAMTPPLLATITGTAAPTIYASVMMPNSVLVVFFADTTGLQAVAIDLVNNVAGAPVMVNASAATPAYVSAFQDTATTLAVGYKLSSAATRVSALSLSGTALTAGAALTLGAGTPDAPMIQLTAGLYAVSIGNTVYGASVAGTVCSAAGSVASGLTNVIGLTRVSNSTALITGTGAGATYYASGRVLTLSGGTVVAGTLAASTTSLANTAVNCGLVPYDASNYLLFGKDLSVATTTQFIDTIVSGTTVTFGAPTAATTNNPSTYVPVTYAVAPGQQIMQYDATRILFGNLSGGPYAVQLSGTAIVVGAVQLSGQTAGTFYRDPGLTTWFYTGSTAFDRFTVGTNTTLTSAEQVAVAPTAYFSATVNNKANKYGASWYAWTVTLTVPVTSTKALTISGNNFLLQGSIS